MLLQQFQRLKRGVCHLTDAIRLQNSKQTEAFFGETLRVFGQNMPVVNFDFNGQITHATKLRRPPPACKLKRGG